MPNAEELFGRHHRDILRYLAHMTGRSDEAEDLAQEVFVRVIRALENGGAIGHERGWVFSIARNLLMDRYRAESRRMAGAVDCEPSMEGAQSLALDLDQSLARLSIVDREIFLLREIGGLTYQEISKECQCTIEGVRARLHRARITLRSMLRPGIPRIPKEAEHERRK